MPGSSPVELLLAAITDLTSALRALDNTDHLIAAARQPYSSLATSATDALTSLAALFHHGATVPEANAQPSRQLQRVVVPAHSVPVPPPAQPSIPTLAVQPHAPPMLPTPPHSAVTFSNPVALPSAHAPSLTNPVALQRVPSPIGTNPVELQRVAEPMHAIATALPPDIASPPAPQPTWVRRSSRARSNPSRARTHSAVEHHPHQRITPSLTHTTPARAPLPPPMARRN